MRHARLVLTALAVSAVTLSFVVAGAAGARGDKGRKDPAAGPHNLPGPLAAKQLAERQVGLQKKLAGKIPAGANVAKLAKGQYVELARTGEDSVWTLLVEFGTDQATHSHGTLGIINHGGTPGPLHNQIAEPDRAVDNTTIWTDDFSRQHFLDVLFSETPGEPHSMREFYIENSSNRYTVNGDVTDWAKVQFNEAAYGSNYCGSIVCVRDIQRMLEDGLNQWYEDQVAAGKTAAEIDAYLSDYDKWDRYDYDGDGNFNESDGYIDHFQGVHAGVGEETGGGAQGTDAIWSHRSYTNVAGQGVVGPPFNKLGGVPVGGSSYWVGDYTVEPENGGSGVFSHEYAHDLGLPDEYDTSGNTGGAENGTGWWTVMSQGSYGTDGTEDLGSRPVHFNAWDKFQLGWLNYAVAFAGKNTSIRLGPAATNTKQAQGMFVILPQKQVVTNLGAPYAGSNFYYSGTADNLDATMTRSFTLPAGVVSFAAKARYNIELDWDYAYLTVNGSPVHTSLSTNTSPNGQNFGEGITGLQTNWVDLTADLSAYAGQTVTLGFRFWTDGAVQGNGGSVPPGFQVDEISITGSPTDGAETDAGWAFSPATGGFRVTTGTETRSFNHYYVGENRQYRGFDDSLRTGPYNFGFLDNPLLQNWVEHFPYQDGLLIHYWDTSYSDNNVGEHPGAGLILPVDSHPAALHFADGTLMRPRLQSYDATFGLQSTDSITLHRNSAPTVVPSQPGVSVFDDLKSWWVPTDPADAPGGLRYQIAWNSVDVPKTGTSIRVVNTNNQGNFMDVLVKPSK